MVSFSIPSEDMEVVKPLVCYFLAPKQEIACVCTDEDPAGKSVNEVSFSSPPQSLDRF